MPGHIAGCLLTEISPDFVLWGNFYECVERDKSASLVAEQELQLPPFSPLHLLPIPSQVHAHLSARQDHLWSDCTQTRRPGQE